VAPARAARWEGVTDQYEARQHALTQKSRGDTVYKPVPPGLLYLDEAAWQAALGARRVLQFAVLPQATGQGVIDSGGASGAASPPSGNRKTSISSAS